MTDRFVAPTAQWVERAANAPNRPFVYPVVENDIWGWEDAAPADGAIFAADDILYVEENVAGGLHVMSFGDIIAAI